MSEISDLIEQKLCRVDDLANNDMKQFDVKLDENKTVQVLLIRYENEFSCLAARCTHYSIPLEMGVLKNGRIRCMAHGACFDVKTGDIEDFPGPDCLPKFDVYVKDNIVHLKATKDELQSYKRIKKSVSDDKTSEKRHLIGRWERPKSSLDKRPISSLPNKVKKVLIKPEDNQPKIVIIGSGAAGMVCIDTLRQRGFNKNHKITVLTEDSFFPYDRPKLSKKIDVEISGCLIRDEYYFQESGINYKNNQTVRKIDFNMKAITSESGEIFNYDKLVIASGSKAVGMPTIPGNSLKGIFTLRSLNDANGINFYFNELNSTGRELNAILIGNSFISMEAVSYFIEKKAKTMIIGRSNPFESAFGSEVSAKIRQLHESKGVKFLIDNNFGVKEFRKSRSFPDALGEVELVNGQVFPCDICLLALGGRPCTQFLENTELRITSRNLIVVDEFMKTNLDDVYAAGDNVSFPRCCLTGLFDSANKADLINIGHWGVANSQGKSAALSLMNDTECSHGQLQIVPFFWSSQFGKNIRFCGYNHKYDSIVFHQDKENPLKFAAFYMLANKLVGVCSLDWDPICSMFAEALHNGIEVKKEHIENGTSLLMNIL